MRGVRQEEKEQYVLYKKENARYGSLALSGEDGEQSTGYERKQVLGASIG